MPNCETVVGIEGRDCESLRKCEIVVEYQGLDCQSVKLSLKVGSVLLGSGTYACATRRVAGERDDLWCQRGLAPHGCM